MKSVYRFTPIPLETNLAVLALSYIWFFIWIGSSVRVAIIAPVLYLILMTLFIALGIANSGDGKKFWMSRLLAVFGAVLPLGLVVLRNAH